MQERRRGGVKSSEEVANGRRRNESRRGKEKADESRVNINSCFPTGMKMIAELCDLICGCHAESAFV